MSAPWQPHPDGDVSRLLTGRIIVCGIAALLAAMSVPRTAAQITLEPASIDLTLAPGESYVETKTVTLPGGSPGTPVDIYFLADTTGSMDPVLDQVQEDAEEILLYLSDSLVDGRFGLGEYKDFPRDAFAFRNNASLTSDMPTVLAGIDALSRAGGGDGCEGQFFALDQIGDPADPFGIGFRAEAQKIIVWFGDAPGHDPICTAISGQPYDITEDSVTAKLVDGGFSVVAIGTTTGFMYALNDNPHDLDRHYRDYAGICTIAGSSGQASRITAATGGVSLQDVDPQDISQAILGAIEFVIAHVTVGLVPGGDTAPFTEILTPPYVDTPLPLSPDEFLRLEFQVRFTGGECDPNLGLHLFTGTVDALVDGATAASQDVTIREPSCDQPPVCDSGGPYSIECQEGTTAVQLDGSASHDPPLDEPVTFAWSTDQPDASFDDDASATPILTLTSNGACTRPVNVYLTVTDRHGLSADCQTSVDVVDTTAPAFDSFPPDRTVECGEATDPAHVGEPTGHDVCSEVAITYVDETEAGCGDSGTITRTWRIEDACGHFVEREQIITILDTTDPAFDSFPPDVEVECPESTEPDASGTPTASDACGDVTLTYSDAVAGDCGSTRTITRTWRIEDACGRVAARDQIITLVDTTRPEFATFPPDRVLECPQATDPASTGQPTGSDACGSVTLTYSDTTAPGCGGTETITRHWRIEDECGNFLERDQTIAVVDTSSPQFDTFPADATLECPAATDPAAVGEPTGGDACSDVTITYADAFTAGCGSTGTIRRTWRVQDACGNHAEREQTIVLQDTTAPEIACPPEITISCNAASDPNALGWASATDACDATPALTYSDDVEIQPCWWDGVVTRTWTATDACGNTRTCGQTITVVDPRIRRALAGECLAGSGSQAAVVRTDLVEDPPEGPRGGIRPLTAVDLTPLGESARVSISEKGSLLVYPKIELRWDGAGNLIQDTFITLNNDFGAEVRIQMYFVSETCADVDNTITLSENEAAYWSSALGQPKGVSPFTVLGEPYPDPDGSDERVLRGYLILWAINDDYAQIRWNHLTGSATIVHYYGQAWEYTAYAFPGLNVANGAPLGVGGTLNLDGNEYGVAFEHLLLDFFASGSPAFSGAGESLVHDTDLTLLILSNDFRRDAPGPATTKAAFEIYNQNEIGFSEMAYCFTKWSSALLSQRGGHFLLENLQTDMGQARISGLASEVCPGSTRQALLGVEVDLATFEQPDTPGVR